MNGLEILNKTVNYKLTNENKTWFIYSPVLSVELALQSCVDVSKAPLAVTWKMFLFSMEEQLPMKSSTQDMPLIRSLEGTCVKIGIARLCEGNVGSGVCTDHC